MLKFKTLLIMCLLGFSIAIQAQHVAVVELFTSEGCSTCPAAEDMMKEMIDLTSKEGKTVIGLELHVTYWNRLGWTDPFSQEQFTARQKKYQQQFNLSSIYTPQMVFNGTREFAGSNPVAFREAVEEAWKQDAKYIIQAKAQLNGDSISVDYTLDRKPSRELLNVAWVQDRVSNHILRGENGGLTLQHMNVVRDLQQMSLLKNGHVNILLAAESDPKEGFLVLFIQDRNTMKVLGATRVLL